MPSSESKHNRANDVYRSRRIKKTIDKSKEKISRSVFDVFAHPQRQVCKFISSRECVWESNPYWCYQHEPFLPRHLPRSIVYAKTFKDDNFMDWDRSFPEQPFHTSPWGYPDNKRGMSTAGYDVRKRNPNMKWRKAEFVKNRFKQIPAPPGSHRKFLQTGKLDFYPGDVIDIFPHAEIMQQFGACKELLTELQQVLGLYECTDMMNQPNRELCHQRYFGWDTLKYKCIEARVLKVWGSEPTSKIEVQVFVGLALKNYPRLKFPANGVVEIERRFIWKVVTHLLVKHPWERKVDLSLETSDPIPLVEGMKKLGMWPYQKAIVSMVCKNRVSIIQGDTGIGKSSGVPVLLDQTFPQCKILVTQPRRMAAQGLAERVSSIYGQRLGQNGGVVGMAMRRAKQGNFEHCRISFCTTGWLKEKLSHDPFFLNNYGILILDEVHERAPEADLCFLLVKDALRRSRQCKLICMSATIAASSFAAYFQELNEPPSIFTHHTYKPFCEPYSELDPVNYDDIEKMTIGIRTQAWTCGKRSLQHLKADKSPVIVESETNNAGQYGINDGPRRRRDVPIDWPTRKDVEELHQIFSRPIPVVAMDNSHCQPHYIREINLSDMEYLFEINASDLEEAMDNDMHAKYHDEAIDLLGKLIEKMYRVVIMNDSWQYWDFMIDPAVYGEQHDQHRPENIDKLWRNDATRRLVWEWTPEVEKSHLEEQAKKKKTPKTTTQREFTTAKRAEFTILVFLPGVKEIAASRAKIETKMKELLGPQAIQYFEGKFVLYDLHSQLEREDQQEAAKYEPGKFKVILSTNIAESSITLPHLDVVIDSGLRKTQSNEGAAGQMVMSTRWCTKSNCQQRKGRVGRTKDGAYIKLYSKTVEGEMKEFDRSALKIGESLENAVSQLISLTQRRVKATLGMHLTVIPGTFAFIETNDFRYNEDPNSMINGTTSIDSNGASRIGAADLLTVLRWDPGTAPRKYGWNGKVPSYCESAEVNLIAKNPSAWLDAVVRSEDFTVDCRDGVVVVIILNRFDPRIDREYLVDEFGVEPDCWLLTSLSPLYLIDALNTDIKSVMRYLKDRRDLVPPNHIERESDQQQWYLQQFGKPDILMSSPPFKEKWRSDINGFIAGLSVPLVLVNRRHEDHPDVLLEPIIARDDQAMRIIIHLEVDGPHWMHHVNGLIEPPDPPHLRSALVSLHHNGATTSDDISCKLTSVGFLSAALHTPVNQARLMLWCASNDMPADGCVMLAAMTAGELFWKPNPNYKNFKGGGHENWVYETENYFRMKDLFECGSMSDVIMARNVLVDMILYIAYEMEFVWGWRQWRQFARDKAIGRRCSKLSLNKKA
eukprot:gene646-213_t